MERSESIANLAAALVKAQAGMAPVSKTGKNPHFNSTYVSLDEAMKVGLALLTKHGLSVTQLPSMVNEQPCLMTMLMHSSGEYIAADQPLMLEGRLQGSQAIGSAITYARRYGFMAAVGMVGDEDDDGNAASAKPQNGRASGAAPIKAPLVGKGAAAPFEGWSVPSPSNFPGKCWACGGRYQKGEAVCYRKNDEGKYDRRHSYDCEHQDVPPLVQQAIDEGGVPLPEEEMA